MLSLQRNPSPICARHHSNDNGSTRDSRMYSKNCSFISYFIPCNCHPQQLKNSLAAKQNNSACHQWEPPGNVKFVGASTATAITCYCDGHQAGPFWHLLKVASKSPNFSSTCPMMLCFFFAQRFLCPVQKPRNLLVHCSFRFRKLFPWRRLRGGAEGKF